METVKKWRREQHRMKVEIKEKNKIINKEAPFLQVPRSWFHYSGGPRAGIDANKRKKKRRRARQRGNRCAPLDSIIVLCAQRFSTFLSRPPFSTTFDANAVANCDHRQIRRLCPVTDNNHRNRQIHSIVTWSYQATALTESSAKSTVSLMFSTLICISFKISVLFFY